MPEVAYRQAAQQKDEWCWSAVASSIAAHFQPGTAFTQCVVASRTLNRGDCCDDGPDDLCNTPWYLHEALAVTGNLERRVVGIVDEENIRAEIRDASEPLPIRIGWHGGGGHFAVITGYEDSVDGLMVSIADPLFGVATVPLDVLKDDYRGSGRWTHTYFVRP